MGFEWYPESSEEKAEYQRMQNEWRKYKQERNTKLGPVAPARTQAPGRLKALVVLLVLFFCVGLFLMVTNVDKPVPLHAYDYIQHTKIINENLNTFHADLEKDFADDGEVEYVAYAQVIETILADIDELKERSFSSLSHFRVYQDACEVYYGCEYDFLQRVQARKEFRLDEFVAYGLRMRTLANPQRCLESLLKEHGYYHYVDDDGVLHYKTFNQSSLSF